MDNFVELKSSTEDFDVEFEIVPVMNSEQQKIQQKIDEIDNRIDSAQQRITGLNTDIDRLTNHADGFDYAIAVSSGILAGLIDSFFVGEFDVNWGSNKANDFVIENAKKQKITDKVNKAIEDAKKKGKTLDEETIRKIKENVAKEFQYSDDDGKQDVLKKAIGFMEKKYNLPGDNVFQTAGRGISSSSHHLDDLAHHPSLLGVLCSILMQFTHRGVYQNSDGITKFWIAEGGLYGTDLKSKLFAGTVNWFWHLVSDVAGSKSTAGAGMGIPGPLMSFAKEIAMIPGIDKTPLPKILNKLFVDKRIDFRVELTFAHELGKQAVPVLINEVVVRSFYFIRRIYLQYKHQGSLEQINVQAALPFKNRTIARMMTIASGTFVAVDMADAAIRAAVKSGCVDPATFASNFILRVNFVGVGRFAIAVGVDIGMGVKRGRLRNERIKVYSELLLLNNAKVYYKQAQGYYLLGECAKSEEKLWITLADNEQAMMEAIHLYENALVGVVTSYQMNKEIISEIGECIPKLKEKNPDMIDFLLDRL